MAERKSRKSSGSDPFAVALRLLGFRDRSSAELAGKLRDRGFPDEAIEPALDRCRDYGYLDDERFALSRARSLVSSGRAVGIRALQELGRTGIDRALAENALAQAESEIDLPGLIDDLRQRRFPGFAYCRADEKEKNRVVSYFQRRGFPVSMILDVLKDN